MNERDSPASRGGARRRRRGALRPRDRPPAAGRARHDVISASALGEGPRAPRRRQTSARSRHHEQSRSSGPSAAESVGARHAHVGRAARDEGAALPALQRDAPWRERRGSGEVAPGRREWRRRRRRRAEGGGVPRGRSPGERAAVARAPRAREASAEHRPRPRRRERPGLGDRPAQRAGLARDEGGRSPRRMLAARAPGEPPADVGAHVDDATAVHERRAHRAHERRRPRRGCRRRPPTTPRGSACSPRRRSPEE